MRTGKRGRTRTRKTFVGAEDERGREVCSGLEVTQIRLRIITCIIQHSAIVFVADTSSGASTLRRVFVSRSLFFPYSISILRIYGRNASLMHFTSYLEKL